MSRAYYSANIADFLTTSSDEILGVLTRNSIVVEPAQRDAWLAQIDILRPLLAERQGVIHFEYSIPRMGRRIDTVLVLGSVVFVLEFKVGEREFPTHALDQVMDYALDLKNFHETSHACWIAPVLIATRAPNPIVSVVSPWKDKLLAPIRANAASLGDVLQATLAFCDDTPLDAEAWVQGR